VPGAFLNYISATNHKDNVDKMTLLNRGFCSVQRHENFRLCALLFFLIVDLRFSTVPRRAFYTSDAVRDSLLEFLVIAKLFSEAEAAAVKTHFTSWLKENRKKRKGVEVDVPADIRAEFNLLRKGIQGYFGYEEPLAALITLSGSKVCVGHRNRDKEQKASRRFHFEPFFAYFKHIQGDKVPLPSVHFLQWFIGFVEGDGCFVLRKTDRYLSFYVTQGAPNRGVLDHIKATLGMGGVGKPDNENVCDYAINRADHIRAIVLLFNGHIVLPSRASQFQRFLARYNKLNPNLRNGPQIPFIGGTLLPTLQDDWLLGFTEAEGCFTCSVLPTATSSLVTLRYFVSQNYEENIVVWKHLQYLFKGGTILRRVGTDKSHWMYAVSGFTDPKRGLPIIYEYFDARELVGIKRAAFPILKELVADAAAGKHRTPAGAEAMKKRCTEVNPVYKGWKAAKDRFLALNEELYSPFTLNEQPLEDIEAGNGLLDGFNEQPLQDIEAGNGLLDGFNGPLPMQQDIGAGNGPLDGLNEHPPTGPKAPGESKTPPSPKKERTRRSHFAKRLQN
jgi:hypothetical protein